MYVCLEWVIFELQNERLCTFIWLTKGYASHTRTLITPSYICLLASAKYLFGVFPIFPIVNRIKSC